MIPYRAKLALEIDRINRILQGTSFQVKDDTDNFTGRFDFVLMIQLNGSNISSIYSYLNAARYSAEGKTDRHLEEELLRVVEDCK